MSLDAVSSDGFVLMTAQGRAVILEDVSDSDLETALSSAALGAVRRVEARHEVVLGNENRINRRRRLTRRSA
jgi:hypothetical protein